MASIERKSIPELERDSSREDEKGSRVDEEVASVVDSFDGDEALKLVGRERTAQFSDEYNRKLRRKLVLRSSLLCVDGTDSGLGPYHSAAMCCCLLHTVSVSSSPCLVVCVGS